MNKFSKTLMLTVALGALATQGLYAQLMAERFYLKMDGGASYLMDTELKDFFGPVSSGTELKFDVGPRFGLGGGYDITDWFAGEFELGFLYNGIDSIDNATEVDAALWTTPFLVNVKLQLPTKSAVVPYVGAGAGGAGMFLDVEHIELEGTEAWGTDSTVSFAYQFFGGVQFKLNEKMALGVEYRFMGIENSDFDGEDGSIELGRIQAHAVSAIFTFRF